MTEYVSQFFAAWGEGDETTRNAQIAETLGQTVFYADPRTPEPLTDPEAVAAYVGQFSKSAPGWPVEAVHLSNTLGFVRATVRFGAGEQSQLGQYVVELDNDGKMTRIVGFAGMGEPS